MNANPYIFRIASHGEGAAGNLPQSRFSRGSPGLPRVGTQPRREVPPRLFFFGEVDYVGFDRITPSIFSDFYSFVNNKVISDSVTYRVI
jgi:hypothetical protein